jgi:hypothetical protein
MHDPLSVLPRIPDEVAVGRRLSYADVTERLMAEFGPRHSLKLVSDAARSCRTGEDGLPRLIAPESLEELVRVRLNGGPAVASEPTP